jgi:uncharacterized membrane protein
MNWIFLAIISVVSLSVGVLYQKIAMKDDESDPVVSSIVFQFLLVICYCIFNVYKGFRWPDISLLLYFLASAVLYAFGTVWFFQAIKRIEASEISIVSTFGSLVTIIISMVFLGDRLSVQQLIGGLLILCVVIFISWNNRVLKINKGVWLALMGTSAYGIAVVFDTKIVHAYSAVNFLPLSSFFTGIILTLWYFRKIPDIISYIKKININLSIFSLLYAIQAIAFYLAIEKGALVGQISTISRANIVLTVILATIFLHERSHIMKKIVGAILVTIGVMLVA